MKEIKVGESLNFNDFLHYASVNGYSRVEQVMEPGEYAVRGDILDIFPTGTTEPLRIDLFGDEVEKIRTFDVLSQRTTGEKKSYLFRAAGEVVLDDNTVKTFRSRYREAFGAAFKDDEIYEAVSNGRKYMGMENWLPFFYEEPLPKDRRRAQRRRGACRQKRKHCRPLCFPSGSAQSQKSGRGGRLSSGGAGTDVSCGKRVFRNRRKTACGDADRT